MTALLIAVGAGGSLLLGWFVGRLLGRRATLPGPLRCPLCADTPRADMEYEPDQLAEHATRTHDAERIYRWTQQAMEEVGADGEIALLDHAFDTIENLTTVYYVRWVARLDTLDTRREYGWLCGRCHVGDEGFPDLEQAQRDRLLTHGCPL